MAKHFLWLVASLIIAGTFGCSICCGPDDYNYGAYGGLHTRSDMQHGRVGSVFSDPNGSAIKLTPYTEFSEPVEPSSEKLPSQEKPKNDLPDPDSKDKKNDGSGTKGTGTQYYQPRRMGKPPTLRRSSSSKRSTRPPRRSASILGGRRVH